MRIRESVKQEIRSALVRTGARLFADQGFAATTVDQVTAAAGVAKGTFYNYFTTKEDLALAVVAGLQAEAAGRVAALAGGPQPASEKLVTLLTAPLEWICANPDLTMVWCVERIRRGRTDGPSALSQGLVRTVQIGQERGEIRPDRPAVLMAAELEGIFLVYILMWYHSGRQPDIRALMADAVTGYLEGAGRTTH